MIGFILYMMSWRYMAAWNLREKDEPVSDLSLRVGSCLVHCGSLSAQGPILRKGVFEIVEGISSLWKHM